MKIHSRATRAFTGLAVASISVIALGGCASGGTGGTGDGGGEKTTVGFSTAVLDNPFTSGLVQSVVDQANEQGLNMLPPINAEGDAGKQVEDFQTLITQGVKGIVLIPRDSDAIVPAVQAANAAGIPVVTVDTAANGGDVYMQVRADNVSMGTSVCEQIGGLLNGEGTVLEVAGYQATSNGLDRSTGFNDCIKDKFPNIKVITQDAEWNTEKSAEIAQANLSTQKVDAVYLASDTTYLDAVASVMKGLDIWHPVGDAGHVPVVTIDGGAGSLDAIRDGYVDAVVSQPVDQYGVWGTQYLLDALAGKTYKIGPTDHDSEIVDYMGTLADMLPSPVVTKDNVDDDTLWGNF